MGLWARKWLLTPLVMRILQMRHAPIFAVTAKAIVTRAHVLLPVPLVASIIKASQNLQYSTMLYPSVTGAILP